MWTVNNFVFLEAQKTRNSTREFKKEVTSEGV